MKKAAVILIGYALCSKFALALPEFNGRRDDDKPIENGKEQIHEKNINAGISDIENLLLARDEMVIRIYADYGLSTIGGHHFDLKEIRINDDEVSMFWYPTCLGGPELPRKYPDNSWRVLQEQDFFTIRDARNFPLRTVIVDGQVQQLLTADGDFYIAQIKTADKYREFMFSTTMNTAGDSDDARRFLATRAAIDAEFDAPTCLRSRPPNQ